VEVGEGSGVDADVGDGPGVDANVGDGLEVNLVVGVGDGLLVDGDVGDGGSVDVGAGEGVSVSASTGVAALDGVESRSLARDARVDVRAPVGVEVAVGTRARRDFEVSCAPTAMNTKKSIAKPRRRSANHNSAGDTAS
jgi:hypothetical protein